MKDVIAVIGAGMSGMSFAHYCAAGGYAVEVFEKEEISGGCIESYALNPARYAELGGHTLTNKYKSVLDILKYYEKLGEIEPTSSLKFELVQGKQAYSILSKVAFPELLFSLPRLLRADKGKKSIRDYYSSILGQGNYQNLFHYFFQAILCQNPDAFPAGLLFRKRTADKSFPGKFTLKEGISRFFDIIGTNPSIHLNHNTPVTAITRQDSRYHLWHHQTRLASVKYLNLSCPPDVCAVLLRQVEPALAEKLNSIKVVNIETVLVEADELPVLATRTKSLIGLKQPFFSALYHHVGEKKYWVFHFEANRSDLAEKRKLIAEVLRVQPGELRVVREKVSRLPALSVQDLDTIEWIKEYIAGKPLFLATNFIEGLAIEDCCVRAQGEFKRLQTIRQAEPLPDQVMA